MEIFSVEKMLYMEIKAGQSERDVADALRSFISVPGKFTLQTERNAQGAHRCGRYVVSSGLWCPASGRGLLDRTSGGETCLSLIHGTGLKRTVRCRARTAVFAAT